MDVTDHTADTLVDAYGLLCPMPIALMSEAMPKIAVGQTIEVIATDPGIKADARAWCEATGHRLVDITEDDEGVLHVFIEKSRD